MIVYKTSVGAMQEVERQGMISPEDHTILFSVLFLENIGPLVSHIPRYSYKSPIAMEEWNSI